MSRLRFTLIALATMALAAVASAESRRPIQHGFASDSQTFPVMGNTVGAGGARFQTHVAILNPTASSFPVEVTLYDTTGMKRQATITLAAHEQKTYENFLDEVFHYTGGGAVTFKAPESVGQTHNNRFIVDTEVFTTGAGYGSTIPALEFDGSTSPSYSAGITVSASSRSNVGCFNQSGSVNSVKATVFDTSGMMELGTVEMKLPANGWGQRSIKSIVSEGFVRFEPSEAAVCYAVVLNNSTNDGRFIAATEYAP